MCLIRLAALEVNGDGLHSYPFVGVRAAMGIKKFDGGNISNGCRGGNANVEGDGGEGEDGLLALYLVGGEIFPWP